MLKELKQSSNRYRTLFDWVQDGIINEEEFEQFIGEITKIQKQAVLDDTFD